MNHCCPETIHFRVENSNQFTGNEPMPTCYMLKTGGNNQNTYGNQKITKRNDPVTAGNKKITQNNDPITGNNKVITQNNDPITTDNTTLPATMTRL